MNKKGFVISTTIYALFGLMTFMVFYLLFFLNSNRSTLKYATDEIVNSIDGTEMIVYPAANEILYPTALNPIVIGTQKVYAVEFTGIYKIELWGAAGGTGNSYSTAGGLGGYTSGEISLSKNDTLNIYVGGKPTDPGNIAWVGGANGGGSTPAAGGNYEGAAGGGATDIRLNSTSLNARIMVAGGGGGGGNTAGGGTPLGGYGGGITAGSGGFVSSYGSAAVGGSQIAGGVKGTYSGNRAFSGTFGIGGAGNYYNSSGTSYPGGGGGGGYYGGGGADIYGGAGGSSYISGHTGCVAVTSEADSTPKIGCTTGTTTNSCSIHYSTKTFTNTSIIDGAGYSWTNTRGSLVNMDNPLGGAKITGNASDGYIKITWLRKS